MAEKEYGRSGEQIANIETAIRQIQQPLQSFIEIQRRIAEVFQPVARQLEIFSASVAPVLGDIERALQDFPAKNRKALRTLALNGWYLDPDMAFPEMFDAATLFEEQIIEPAHQKLCDHFDSRLDHIQRDICDRFADRGRLLKLAFDAHRGGEYALAIPVFLSQADGICEEFVGVGLYARRNGVPLLATHLGAGKENTIDASFYGPLVEPTPISANRKERIGVSWPFNRHAILHGESLDYDTRLNSYRAISFLAYVIWVLDRRPDETPPESCAIDRFRFT